MMKTAEELKNGDFDYDYTDNGVKFIKKRENGDIFETEQADVIECTRAFMLWLKDNIKVGDGMTVKHYTDQVACTVIGVKGTTITLQRDNAIRLTEPNMIIGGFSAICINNKDIEYKYERDTKGQIFIAKWSKSKNKFVVDKYSSLLEGRREFYDYNF